MELVWDGVTRDSAFLISSQLVLDLFILEQHGVAKIYGSSKQSPGMEKAWLYYNWWGIHENTDVWALCHMVQVSRS